MRSAAVVAFAGIANAALISAPPAESTEYSTYYVTVTSCDDYTPDCPAESTVVSESYVPLTTSTIYETEIHTVTKCPGYEVECPGSETVVYETETIAVSTTVCPVDEVEPTPEPEYPEPEPEYPSKEPEYPEPSAEPEYPEPEPEYPEPSAEPEYPEPSAEPEYPEPELCPTESVKTIVYSTEITTVIPTVITKYETATLEVPCPEPTEPVKPSDVPVPPPHYPSGNVTVPEKPVESEPVEGAAAGLSGSVLVAAVAAVAAYVFA